MSWVCESIDQFGNRRTEYCTGEYAAAHTEAGRLARAGVFARVMEIRPQTKKQYRYVGPWLAAAGIAPVSDYWEVETREVPA